MTIDPSQPIYPRSDAQKAEDLERIRKNMQTQVDSFFYRMGVVVEVTLVPDGKGLRMRGYKPIVSVRARR